MEAMKYEEECIRLYWTFLGRILWEYYLKAREIEINSNKRREVLLDLQAFSLA